MTKLYDRIKDNLEHNELYRNSDKHLMWRIWYEEGLVKKVKNAVTGEDKFVMIFDDFVKATSPESIRRCRQKIQEKISELGPTTEVNNFRRKKQKEKGSFVYREKLK
jgi:hypothetical protein